MVFIDETRLWMDGYGVIARNPWSRRGMREVLAAVSPDKLSHARMKILRRPPPWSKARYYIEGASENQLKVWYEFGKLNAELAERYKDLPKYERLRRRLLDVREALSGKTFGRKPRIRTPVLPVIERRLRGMVVAPAAPPPPSPPAPPAPEEEIVV